MHPLFSLIKLASIYANHWVEHNLNHAKTVMHVRYDYFLRPTF